MKKIYQLVPQMKYYNNIGVDWRPLLMNLQKANYRSDVINTDGFGLRFNDKILNSSIFEEKEVKKKHGIMIGSSAVFGVGASSDKLTIPSILSNITDKHFYNIGGRAYSGFQEIILFNSLINQFKDLDEILIFSGFNDIFLNSYIDNYHSLLGPVFFNNEFIDQMSNVGIDKRKKFIRNFLNFFEKKDKNLNKKNKNILDIIKRNLNCWSIIQKGFNIKISYILQPFANWCKRELCDEEKIIFNELDKLSFKTKRTLELLDMKVYDEFSIFLENTCNEFEIKFFDCNKFLSDKNFDNKWIFVDRIHLTDNANNYIAKFIKSSVS